VFYSVTLSFSVTRRMTLFKKNKDFLIIMDTVRHSIHQILTGLLNKEPNLVAARSKA
jgi:hypothetical protein